MKILQSKQMKSMFVMTCIFFNQKQTKKMQKKNSYTIEKMTKYNTWNINKIHYKIQTKTILTIIIIIIKMTKLIKQIVKENMNKWKYTFEKIQKKMMIITKETKTSKTLITLDITTMWNWFKSLLILINILFGNVNDNEG